MTGREQLKAAFIVVALIVIAVTFLPILAAYYLTREGEHTGAA